MRSLFRSFVFCSLFFFSLSSTKGFAKTPEFFVIYDNSSPLSAKVESVILSLSQSSSAALIDFYLVPYSMHETAPRIDASVFEKVESKEMLQTLRSRPLSTAKLNIKDALQSANLVLQWRMSQNTSSSPYLIFIGDTKLDVEKVENAYQVDSRTQGLMNELYRKLDRLESDRVRALSIFIETEAVSDLIPLQEASLLAALDSQASETIYRLQMNPKLPEEIILYATNQDFEQIRRSEVSQEREKSIRQGQRDDLLRKPAQILTSSSQIQASEINLKTAEEFLPRSLDSHLVFPFRYIAYPDRKNTNRNILEVSRDQFVLDYEMIELLPKDLLLKLSRGRNIKALSTELERQRAHQDKEYWAKFFKAIDPDLNIRIVELNGGESFKLLIEFNSEISIKQIYQEVEKLSLNGRLYDFDSVVRNLEESKADDFISKESVKAMRVKDWMERLKIVSRPRNLQNFEVDYVASTGNSFYFGLGKKYLELKIQYREPLLDPLLIKKLGPVWLKSRTDATWEEVELAFEEDRINDASRGVSFFFNILERSGFRPEETKIDSKKRQIVFRFASSLGLYDLQKVLSRYSLSSTQRDLQAVYMLVDQWKLSKTEEEKQAIFEELQRRFSLRSAVQY